MKTSAGILMYRRRGDLQFLLIHPGGPYWAKKDAGAWSIPKGLYVPHDESPIEAARREFWEETGARADGELVDLGSFKQPGGKAIHAFALEGDFDLSTFKSNLFSLEWPPKSGEFKEFPEADRADWFAPEAALEKITKGQAPIIEALLARCGGD